MNKTEFTAALYDILDGIDKTKDSSRDGWWDSDLDADFGAETLRLIAVLLESIELKDTPMKCEWEAYCKVTATLTAQGECNSLEEAKAQCDAALEKIDGRKRGEIYLGEVLWVRYSATPWMKVEE